MAKIYVCLAICKSKAQWYKICPPKQETQEMQVWTLGWEDPLKQEKTTHSTVLARKIPWTEKPCGPQSVESESWAWLSTHACKSISVSTSLVLHLGTIEITALLWRAMEIFHCLKILFLPLSNCHEFRYICFLNGIYVTNYCVNLSMLLQS